MIRVVRAACTAGLTLCLMAATPAALAQNQAEIAELRDLVETLSQRIETLEAEAQAQESATNSDSTGGGLEISADVRYRHDQINEEFEPGRARHRIRARIGIDAPVTDNVTLGLQLATGGGNPISQNQTLDGGFSLKDVDFTRAYFVWELSPAYELHGGKIRNPFMRAGGHGMIFDGDLNPEGVALRMERENFFANVAGLWADERSGGDDGILFGVQAGFRGMLPADKSYTLGVSSYNYRATQGYTPFYDGDAAGNFVDGADNYLYDFNLAELFGELAFEVAGHPLTVFADFVRNTEADEEDTGFAVGARFRRASAPRSWDVSYAWQDLEANAVLGRFTDSDFSGGGTDNRGHMFRLNYVLRENVDVRVSYFVNERDIAAGNEHDYRRLMADIMFSY